MPASHPPDRPRQQPRNELQRQSILEVASRLFIDKGFGGTKFNDLADALGVTRTAVYYYFQSKEAILEALTEEVTQRAGELARGLKGQESLPPQEALRQLVLQHATLILTHPMQFRVVERSESSLPEPARAAARAARHAVLDQFVQTIEKGVAAGVFQVPEPRVAAFALIGICNWGAWWYEPDQAPVETVANMLTEMALRSLVRDVGTHRPPASLAEAIGLLRENVDALEALARHR
ncbi:TetR/AcrR family transcriptional regulator [Ramlibacter sp. AW1]|uniref:TetR/AcrR family transcriptional regulator n=1 Tax=Ramlibacter aurantiacus TaxID=2801330 RepID=A0A936ZT73_9BURK|nr:TetR/AcrR family transcriptional regulator [Ramlibacter aurantiacus]MBL0420705.1 TetR/AcrR family transcriptional regulator [Ramlibacter aurantiacus]